MSPPPDLYELGEIEPGFDPRIWLEGLWRRRRLAAGVFAVALIPGLYVPFSLPDQFQAEAQVAMQEAPEVLEFGSDFMPGNQFEGGRRSSPLAPLMGVIASDAVLGAVVDQMPDPGPRKPRLRDRLLGTLGLSRDERTLSPELRRRLRIDGLRNRMELDSAGGATILVIRFAGTDPAQAATLANGVADSYVNFERERRQSASRIAINWLSQKSNELRDRIRRREEAAAKLIQEAGIRVQPGGQPGALLENNQMALELQTARADLMFAEQQLAQIAPEARRALAAGREGGPRVRDRYLEAKAQLESLRLQFTPNHPEVRRMEAVVEGMREEAEGEPAGAPSEQVLGEQNRLVAERARLRARVDVLTRALDAQQTDPNQEALSEYSRLERELAIDRSLLQVLLQRTNETALEAAGATEPASVLDYALTPVTPIGPKRGILLLAGIGGALGLGVGLALLREMIDARVYDPASAAKALRAPYLGGIPLVGATEAERRGLALYASPAGESFRNVRTSLLFASGGARLRTVLVTSAVAGEGKTTVSTNLAVAFASVGRRVLLVDADMRRPRVDRVLELKRSPGLSELLDGAVGFEQVVHRSAENLDVLTSGAVPQNPTELLSSPAFDLLFARSKKAYDLVLIDAPILLAVSDALLLSGRVDGVLIVHKPGSVERRALEKTSEDLRRMEANVLGVIFNQVSLHDPYQYPSYMRSPYVIGSTPRRWVPWRRRERGDPGARGKSSGRS